MPIAGCGQSDKPSESEDANKPTGSAVVVCSKGAGEESKTNGNRIDIVFDPDKSSKVKKCDKIVHVPFIQMTVDDVITKPGDYYSGFKYRDSVTTDDGWYVDHLQSEKTPDYQQGNGDGSKNGGTTKASMVDAPQDSRGGVFYDPITNKTGWKKVKYSFVAFAYCMKGSDCGKWYEGVRWEYNKTWEDQRDGKKGESKITDNNVTTGPTKSQLEAFEKFNKAKGFTPCK